MSLGFVDVFSDRLNQRLQRGPNHLKLLDLSGLEIAHNSWPAVLDHPSFGAARGIVLDANPNFDAACAQTLAQSGHLVHLEMLSFKGCPIGDAGLAALANTPDFAQLQRLTLGACRRSANQPAKSGRFAIYVTNEVTDRGLEALITSPYLTKLVHLDLSYIIGSTATIAKLCEAPWLPQLQSLHVMSCYEWGEANSEIFASRPMPQLETLTLEHSNVGDKGLVALAKGVFPTLKTLSLQLNGITDVSALAGSRGLPTLTSLDVSSNPIGASGIVALRPRRGLPALRRVGLSGCQFFTEQIETYTDWTGSVVGEGAIAMTLAEIRAAYVPDLEVF